MAFGVQAFDSAGTLIFDTTSAGGGVVADLIDMADGAALVKEYPGYAGHTCRAMALSYAGPYGTAVDYVLGWPRLTISSGLPRQILVTMA